jgi:uncharacterized membrane protein
MAKLLAEPHMETPMSKSTSVMTGSALFASSVLGALALATAAAHAGPVAQPAGSEKCYGIAKAAKNDCGAGAHSCAGEATMNKDKASFVYLPVGACSKIAGASLTPGK